MERLTKQNHNLKEQLRQKNATLNTQKEDKEGTNTKRRKQEGLEGKQTRATGYQPTIYHRYGSPSHSHRNTDDEGMDGLHDERPQRMGV